jgi:hypothetical protein
MQLIERRRNFDLALRVEISAGAAGVSPNGLQYFDLVLEEG